MTTKCFCNLLFSKTPHIIYKPPFFFRCSTVPSGPRPLHYRGFTITLRHTTNGRTLLDEWSAQRRDLYLASRHTHNRHTSMLPAVFEITIPARELPQTHALDRAATGVGKWSLQRQCTSRALNFILDGWNKWSWYRCLIFHVADHGSPFAQKYSFIP